MQERQQVTINHHQHHHQSLHLLAEVKQEEVYHLLVTSPLLVAATLLLLAMVLHGHQGCQTLSGVCVTLLARTVLATVLLVIAFSSLYRSRGRGESNG